MVWAAVCALCGQVAVAIKHCVIDLCFEREREYLQRRTDGPDLWLHLSLKAFSMYTYTMYTFFFSM